MTARHAGIMPAPTAHWPPVPLELPLHPLFR